MRRAFPPQLSRRFAEAAAAAPRAPPDLRSLRDARVAEARERVFGPTDVMPGDRFFRRALEGRKLMRWYFPSKYNMQDFRVDDYFEMQAERLAPREPHRCVAALTKTLENVSRHRAELRDFFGKVEEATFLNSPSLQDLYGLFRLVDNSHALSFTNVPEQVFREHSPLFSGDDSPFKAEPFASPVDLQLLIEAKAKPGDGNASRLQARVALQQTRETVHEVLRKEQDECNAVPDFKNVAVVAEAPALRAYALQRSGRGRDKVKAAADRDIEVARKGGPQKLRDYLGRRHRFVDPMYRRRRLKWIERQQSGLNKETEVKFNSYYIAHPDQQEEWPTNKGSVTVTWPALSTDGLPRAAQTASYCHRQNFEHR
eukprot:CAMPEP_0117543462 /NCGR_PEP_ID=MMETSP0784-20121206/45074_1 /TAXON_ID=39447 /ORGANISM="" /LENGTH=369 /DNA_ID=CAMNT_0005340243 /DNA_START=19 /DNA_END=1126 /DNA_ORIENTATION=+